MKFFAFRDVDCRRRRSHDAAGVKNAFTPPKNKKNKKETILPYAIVTVYCDNVHYFMSITLAIYDLHTTSLVLVTTRGAYDMTTLHVTQAQIPDSWRAIFTQTSCRQEVAFTFISL